MGFATIAAAASLASTAASTGASFAQAAKQRKLQRQAESEAEKAMQEAKKKLEVNYFKSLAIAKEPYALEREAMLVQGAMATEAGRESQRGAAATAGRVQMAQQQGQRQIAAAMSQDIAGLEKLTAQEESRLRDLGVGLNLEEAKGAQLAAANAQEMAGRKTTEALKGVASTISQAAALAPLYEKTAAVRNFNKLQRQAEKAGLSPQQFQQQLAAFGKSNPQFANLSDVAGMKPMQFQDYMIGLKKGYLKDVVNSFDPMGLYIPSQYGTSAQTPEFQMQQPEQPTQIEQPSWGGELNYFAPYKM